MVDSGTATARIDHFNTHLCRGVIVSITVEGSGIWLHGTSVQPLGRVLYHFKVSLERNLTPVCSCVLADVTLGSEVLGDVILIMGRCGGANETVAVLITPPAGLFSGDNLPSSNIRFLAPKGEVTWSDTPFLCATSSTQALLSFRNKGEAWRCTLLAKKEQPQNRNILQIEKLSGSLPKHVTRPVYFPDKKQLAVVGPSQPLAIKLVSYDGGAQAAEPEGTIQVVELAEIPLDAAEGTSFIAVGPQFVVGFGSLKTKGSNCLFIVDIATREECFVSARDLHIRTLTHENPFLDVYRLAFYLAGSDQGPTVIVKLPFSELAQALTNEGNRVARAFKEFLLKK